MSIKFQLKSLLGLFPDLKIRNTSDQVSPLLLLVGSPRCGSTVTSQYLINNLKLDYIDNISCIFCFQIRRTFQLLRAAKLRTLVSTNSLYGNTTKYGYLNPSECGDFFYKYFPYGQHEVNSISPNQLALFENELRELLHIAKRPVILKNLANSLRLSVYRKMNINVKIIYVERDQKKIIKSIMKARHDLKIAKSDAWSIRVKGFDFDSTKSEYDNVKSQVEKIIEVLENELQNWDDDKVIRIHYEDLERIDYAEIKEWLYTDK